MAIFLKNDHCLTLVSGKIVGLKRKKCVLTSGCKLQGQEKIQLVLKIWWKSVIFVSLQK